MSLKILHTGDTHLGAPFKSLGSRAQEQRKQLRTTFTKVIDTALEQRVHVVLIAGDLFDSNRVSDAEIAFARKELQRLETARIPVVLIGGTHDCLAEGAVLKREGVISDLDNVTLLTPKEPQKVFPEYDLTISGTSNTTNKSRTSPLSNFPKEAGTAFHVGMIHGSLAIPTKHAPTDFPFTQEEIAGTGLDYLAIGHWHSLNDISAGETTAYYCGSPEPIDFGEHRAGFTLVVSLEENKKPVVEPVQVGKRQFQKEEIDVTGYQTTVEITKKILCNADGDCAYEITLTGVRRPELQLDQKSLEEELSDSFFKLVVKDKTEVSVEDMHAESIPEHLVLGQFLRRMKSRMEAAETKEERQVIETALQIGMTHLKGKEE